MPRAHLRSRLNAQMSPLTAANVKSPLLASAEMVCGICKPTDDSIQTSGFLTFATFRTHPHCVHITSRACITSCAYKRDLTVAAVVHELRLRHAPDNDQHPMLFFNCHNNFLLREWKRGK